MIAVLCPQCGIACDVPPDQFLVEKTCAVCGGWFLPAAARREPVAAPPPPTAPPAPMVVRPPAPVHVPPRAPLPPPVPCPSPPTPVPSSAVPPAPAPGKTGTALVGAVVLLIVVRMIAGLLGTTNTQTPVPTARTFGPAAPAPQLTANAARVQLVGKWRLVYQSTRAPGTGYDYRDTRTFRSDGTMLRPSRWSGIEDSDRGTYRVNEDVSLNWTFNGIDTRCRIVSLSSTYLTISYQDGGTTVEERFVRVATSP